MRIRLATAGLLALAVLASVLSVDVADPEPASAHTKTHQDCTWVQSTNYTIIRYDYDPNYVEWVEPEPGYGHYVYGRFVPMWGYERYRSCGPVMYVPHSHRLGIPAFVCPLAAVGAGVIALPTAPATGGAGPIVAGGVVASACGGYFVYYQTSGH